MRRPRKIWVPPAARNRTPVQHYLPRLLERIEKGEIDPARQAAAKVGLEQHAGLPGGIIMRRTVFAILGLLVAIPSLAGAQQDRTTDSAVADFQKDFAAAYNRGDVDAMAAAFTEKAVRVTPSGIFQGRDAIRRGFQDAQKLGLHDYSVRRVISR
jgi:SnoaL-like domain